MSRFNVGDKVKIVRTNLCSQREYIGCVREVVDTEDDGVYLDNMPGAGDYYLDSELALIEPNVDSLYPHVVQPNFKLSEELEEEWKKLVNNSYNENLCGKNIFPGCTWLNEVYEKVLDNEEHCDFCKYSDNCHGISCHGGEPIEPPCAYQTATEYVDNEKFYQAYIKGIWDYKYQNKEEKDMNKVVNLWYERNRDKIVDKYKEMEFEFYNNKYSIVESFNELVDTFNNNLEDLYKLDKATEQFVLKENAPKNVVKYCLDLDKLKEEFEVEYLTKRNEELKEIEDIRLEVEAQLSLSDDLEYQTKILRRYGIIDKKTNKIVG